MSLSEESATAPELSLRRLDQWSMDNLVTMCFSGVVRQMGGTFDSSMNKGAMTLPGDEEWG